MANRKSSAEISPNQETLLLLKDIVDELRNIRSAQTRQDERIKSLIKNQIWPVASADVSSEDTETEHTSSDDTAELTHSVTIPPEQRAGPLLSEALRRYKLNIVPSWGCLFGTHSMPGSHDLTGNVEWSTSMVGELWKIPHDNRMSLCFKSLACDPTDVDRVCNFISLLHVPSFSGDPKGQYFNVWDWFDTGLSAYWYPGIATSEQGIYGSLLQSSNRTLESELAKDSWFNPSPMVAPWRRMINMQGLTSLSKSSYSNDVGQLSDLDLCPFLAETKDSVFPEPMSGVLWQAIRRHLRCYRTPENGPMETNGTIIFHITFYEILNSRGRSETLELWPCGDLHSDCQDVRGPRKLRESALTIITIPSVGLPGSKLRSIFWTMLCLRPNQFPHQYYFERRDDLMKGCAHEMLDDMSDIVYGSLLAVIDRWEEIAHYFDNLLAEKKALLNPSYHDSLLNDDSALTRSKRYFWAIEFLKEVEASICDNLKQARRFVALMTANPPSTVAAQSVFASRLHKHQMAIRKLETLKLGFKHKQDEAKALRDGLFSASAVMESRAATQLGENIKLLTYVSIFFLPISLCTSFWSVNNALFSLTSLAIVLPIIAVSTYTVVLNLDYVIKFFQMIGLSLRRLSHLSSFANYKFRDGKAQGNTFVGLAVCTERTSCSGKFQVILQQAIINILSGFSSLMAFVMKPGKKWYGKMTKKNAVSPGLNNLRDVCVEVEVTMDVEHAAEIHARRS
ncbi:hypothetical protein F5884DRAFT_900166 [Xylogone sp. PMI_703]|nr:hypothetical protein F5884DRAFT_900166 [Xylogone sp. PMI_703]